MTGEIPPEWVLYLRKSRGRTGIARQRTITTAHIERHGGTVSAAFTDTDRTAFQKTGGARPVREDFDRMIAYLRAHPGAGVAAWHADRLLRNPADTELLIETCAAGGHLVETPSGGSYDLSTASGRKRLRSDAIDAAYEVDHAIERITAAKNEAVAAGMDLGGRRRFGWARRADGFGIIAAEAQLIVDGTQAIIAGASLRSVTRAWNASGMLTSTGSTWQPTEVRRVLCRARNAGLLEHHGVVTGKGTNWEPIVGEAEWRACRAILTTPERRTSPGPARRWLLSGIAVCEVCSTPVVATMSAGKGRPPRPVYRDRPRGSPGHVARGAGPLDAWVANTVIKLIPRLHIPAHAPDLAHLHAELAAVKAEMEELAAAAGRRQLTARQLVLATGPLQETERQLQARLDAATAPNVLAPFSGRPPREVWLGLDLDQRRAVVRELMTVVIKPAPRGRTVGWRPGEHYFDPGSVDLIPRVPGRESPTSDRQ